MKHRNLYILLSIMLFSMLVFTNLCFALTVTISKRVPPSWWPRASKAGDLSIAPLEVTIDNITNEDQYKVIQITLDHVTNYQGICGNSTVQDIIDTNLKKKYYDKTSRDLIFTQEDNPGSRKAEGFSTLRYQIKSDNTLPTITLPVGVRSLDYGGYGEVHADVFRVKKWTEGGSEFEYDGKKYKPDDTFTKSRDTFARVPRDDNFNKIADSWQNDFYALDPNTKLRNFKPGKDTDPSTNSIHVGDRIIVFEEYRGFMTLSSTPGYTPTRVTHSRTSPDTKEIFIVNQDARTATHGKGTEHSRISAYLVPSTHVKTDGQFNFNKGGFSIVLKPSGMLPILSTSFLIRRQAQAPLQGIHP